MDIWKTEAVVYRKYLLEILTRKPTYGFIFATKVFAARYAFVIFRIFGVRVFSLCFSIGFRSFVGLLLNNEVEEFEVAGHDCNEAISRQIFT
jgi:hypothetical protein